VDKAVSKVGAKMINGECALCVLRQNRKFYY